MNKLSFDHPYLANKGSSEGNLKGIGERYSVEDIMLTSYFSSELGTQDPIESAIRKEAEEKVEILGNRNSKSQYKIPGYNVDSFTPFNPTTKYTEAKVTDLETGKQFRCVKGAPHIIVELCGGHKEGHEAVIDLANRGLRALGVARTNDLEMEKFELIGMVSLLDPPRIDSGETIRECQKLGVEVKMITGDQAIIGREVARRLGMGRCILDAPKLVDPTLDAEELTARVIKADGFAQVIPEHKFKVVELLQHAGIMVAMTGDGVNDAPALKKANVGIAVEGCTDAARSASDIVLLAPGLSTIVDAIKISREIFQRMRSYALYRITSTIHFLLFFFFSILIFDFTLPSRLILSIAVLNDAAAIVIAVDNARPNIKPDKWRLGQLIFLSFILGFFLCLASYGHFLVGKFVFELDPAVLQTVMYLQISSNPHFIIFSTRLVDPFWFSAPSPMFLFVILLTQVIGLFMSVYGFEHGWSWGLAVLGTSLLTSMALDFIKVAVYKHWSFDMTAKLFPSSFRRNEVLRRNGRAVIEDRLNINIAKVRRQMKLISAVRNFEAGISKETSGEIKNMEENEDTYSRK